MTKLWNHQKYAIDKYKGKKFFGLLFDMGLGKTLTAIKLAEEKTGFQPFPCTYGTS